MRKHVSPEIWEEMFLLMEEQSMSPDGLAKAMNVGRSTVYKKLKEYRDGGVKERRTGSGRPSNYNRESLKSLVFEVLEELPPVAGYRRVHRAMKRKGFAGSFSTTYRLMRELNLLTPPRRKRHYYKWEPVRAENPDEAWLMDTTEYHVGMNKYQVYIAIDVFSRRVYAKASLYRDSRSTVDFLEGINGNKPLKIYSDGGSEFDNYDVKAYLKEVVDVEWEKLPPYCPEARGMVERVVRTLKEEWLDWKEMLSYEEFQTEVKEFVEWYNTDREHSSLNYKVPMEVYESGSIN